MPSQIQHSDKERKAYEHHIQIACNEVMQNTRATLNSTYPDISAAACAIYEECVKESLSFTDGIMGSNDGIDIHKMCSCLCSAILKCDVLAHRADIDQKHERMFWFPNELLAYTLVTELLKERILSEDVDDVTFRFVVENLPYSPPTISDNHMYVDNFLAYLNASYRSIKVGESFFDVYAYSLVLYHLDFESRKYIEQNMRRKPDAKSA